MHARSLLSLALAGLGLAALLLIAGSPWAGPQATVQGQGLPSPLPTAPPTPVPPPPTSRYFPETGHTVGGRFLEYWNEHGGLAQQGYPLSDEVQEISEVNGQPYTVQYFERAVFERHPEYSPPYDVLLTLLGVFEYQKRYGAAGAPNQHVSTDNPRFFPETRHTVGGKFRAYWESHGELAQQGYPLSEEFTEVSALNGRPYTVQYFQRAVFEWHPENAGTPYEVLLSQLGTFRYRAYYGTLPIPTPEAEVAQGDPHGAGAYLVWGESPTRPLGGAARTHLFGLDLATNHSFLVTSGAGNQLYPTLSGSVVVWADDSHSCPTCEMDVMGKNLATGATFTVASGPADQRLPAVSGNRVAWLEAPTVRGTSRLLLKDLGSGAVTMIATDTESLHLHRPVLSDAYLVWSETNPNGVAPAGTLRAYDLRTRTIQTVATLQDGETSYALDGTRVVWDDYLTMQPPFAKGIHFGDLATGERTILVGSGRWPLIQSDTVFWEEQVGQDQIDLWGLKLADRRPRLLVSSAGSPAVAGEWLVYRGREPRLHSIALARAFAAAQATPTAGPSPTPTAASFPTFPALQTPGPAIRYYAPNVADGPLAVSHYVFFTTPPHEAYITPTPPGGLVQDLFGYDLSRNEPILDNANSTPGLKALLASDGQTLAWIERRTDRPDTIRGFNLATRTEFPILTAPAGQPYDGLTLDGGVLYYVDRTPGHLGLFARPLAGGPERLVTAAGDRPVAADGVLLWSEEQAFGPEQSDFTLHLQRAGTTQDRVIAHATSYFSSYAVAGDTVVWPGPATQPGVWLYRISTGQAQMIFPGAVDHVTAGGHTVVWSDFGSPAPDGQSYSIAAYDLLTGRTSSPVHDVRGPLAVWGVAEDAVLFTIAHCCPPPEYTELFLVGLSP
jgi:hypothetical protein